MHATPKAGLAMRPDILTFYHCCACPGFRAAFSSPPRTAGRSPSRTRKNGDGYDIVGCAGAVREGELFRGIAEVHAVSEHGNWFFTGWTFRDSSEESCKQLSDPNWQPDSPLEWNKPMQELARAH